MIEEVNGERTGKSSNMTTCIIVNFQDYQKKPYFPWSTDPLNYCLSEKSSGSIRPLLMWSKTILYYRYFRSIGEAFLCRW
jgi:hypothetical protein